MREETIEKVFSSRDWRDGVCDTCCEFHSVVLVAEKRVCRECLELFHDEEGEEILTKAFTPEPRGKIAMNVILGMTAAFISGALFMAAILLDNAEVSAYTGAVWGGK